MWIEYTDDQKALRDQVRALMAEIMTPELRALAPGRVVILLVVDTKVVDNIGDHELGQMLNYLKITGLTVGLILNFKHKRLDWKRVVRTA